MSARLGQAFLFPFLFVAPLAAQREQPVDVTSREVSVFVEPAPAVVSDVVSREVSLFVAPPEPVMADVVSREVTVFAPEALAGPVDVISREVSVLAPAPDLVASVPVAPLGVTAGQEMVVDWGVTNIGAVPAEAPWNDVVVLSRDLLIFNGDDLVVSSKPRAGDLIPGATYLRSDTCMIPPGAVGNYYVFVIVDYQSDVFELGSGANAVAAPAQILVTEFPRPDLAVTLLSPPGTATDGEAATVQFIVSNVGTFVALGQWFDQLYLSADPVYDGPPTDTALGPFVSAGANEAGTSYVQTAVVSIPAGLSGDHWFIARTDDNDLQNDEQDETNNTRVASAPTFIFQPDKPDLEVTNFSLLTPGVAEVFEGVEVTLQWTVANSDPVGTANGAWVDRVYLSTDAVLDPTDTLLGTGGFSGARGPGETYLQTVQFDAPAMAGSYTVFVVADEGFVAADEGGDIEETDEENNTASLVLEVLAPTYTATVSTTISEELTPATVGGLSVILSGQAIDNATLLPRPDVDVAVRVRHKGTRREFIVETDTNGDYSIDYLALPGEAGLFELYAGHPAVDEDPLVDPPQATFRLLGLRISPSSLARNLRTGDTFAGQVSLINLGNTPVTGITTAVAGVPPYLQLANLAAPTDLAGSASGFVTFDLTATTDPPVNDDQAEIEIDIFLAVDDVGTLGDTLTVQTLVTPQMPNLQFSRVSINGTMVIGEQSVANLSVRNDGGALAQDVVIALDCVDLPETGDCITTLITPQLLGNLQPGEERLIEIGLLPPDSVMADDVYGGSVQVFENSGASGSPSATVPFTFTAVSTRTGTLSVTVEDELTYYALDGTANEDPSAGPFVADARIELTKPNNVALSYSADAPFGEVVLEDVVEGFYNLSVTAPNHGSSSRIVHIGPGSDEAVPVFLPTRAVSYEWSVVPTTIEDEYQVTITAVFETFIPVPKLIITPSVVQLDLLPGESMQVDLQVFNDGLIPALGTELVNNAIPGYAIDPLITEIGDIGPMQTVTIPVLVSRPVGFEASRVDCNAQISWGVQHYIVCGVERWYWTPVYWQYPSSDCGGDGIVGGAPPSFSNGGGGSGGSSSSPYYSTPTYDVSIDCQPPPEGTETPPPPCPYFTCCWPSEPGEAPGSGVPMMAATGSGGDGWVPLGAFSASLAEETDPVILPTGELFLTEEDMRIAGRGLDFAFQRTYVSKRGGTMEPDSPLGFGWDYNFNMLLSRSAEDVLLDEANGRVDLYEPLPDGTWARDEYFRTIHLNPDGTYTVRMPDRTAWNFLPVNGGPTSGKLQSVVDRNGNRLLCEYDASGRLERVLDSLNRPVDFGYDSNGFLVTVTDFTSRTWTYEYYEDGEDITGDGMPDGAFGDLKSVTTPPVVGTPNGNDFPLGKTTVYTYSTGSPQAALNHNLLTVRDPRGNVFLENTYHPTEDILNRDYDRLVRQRWGDEGDVVDIYQVPVVPTFLNRNAIRIVIVNDRVGNLTEYDFDVKNRLVARRDYTGRADPDQPTTLSTNRPQSPLRGSDPLFFQTLYSWNLDSLLVRREEPNGTETEFIWERELDPAAIPRARGNLREVYRRPGSYPLVGDQPLLSQFFTYDVDTGGCCGSDWVKTHQDARGHITTHDYDPNGNRLRTVHRIASIVEDWEYNAFGQMTAHVHPDNGFGHRRRDEYTYHNSGPQRGYRQTAVIDAGLAGESFALETEYEYDGRGNLVRLVDPRGNDTLFTINALDQVVRETSRPVATPSGAVRYEKDYSYDANDNLVRVGVQNIDETGNLDPNPYITTIFEYEILNRLTKRSEEEAEGDFVVTEYVYDSNRNLIRTLGGEATNGNDPFNLVDMLYDERDLLYRTVRGAGGPLQSSEQYDYDGNGNRTSVSSGLEDGPHVTELFYDAYDRLVLAEDPMGNVEEYGYDPNSNRELRRVEGELTDISGGAANVRLAEETSIYDLMDRLRFEERAFFDTATQNPIADGLSTREWRYSDNSQLVEEIDDNGRTTTFEYDTANRLERRTDASGNSVDLGYDANSNVTSVLSSELSDSGAPTQLFTTSLEYDSLDRRTAVVDNVGNRVETAYDSRDNPRRSMDALGNVAEFLYDGLDRRTTTIRYLTDDGTSGGTPAGDITTLEEWDDSSRLVAQTDDNGNRTTYGYDSLNRQVTTTHEDGTVHSVLHDVHDNPFQMQDAIGSLVLQTFDDNDRLAHRAVTVGAGVSDQTTFESFSWDGRGRLVSAVDDDSTVLRAYDSISNVTFESQNGFAVGATYDGVGNQTSLSYPGGRTTTTSYDSLDRKRELRESPSNELIASYSYVGPARVESKSFGNGTRVDITYDGITGTPNAPGDFGVGRIVRTLHTRESDGLVLDDRSYAWDRMQNKTLLARTGETRVYGYDSVYRLTRSETTPSGSPTEVIDYLLDGVGNRTEVIGGDGAGLYGLDASVPPADYQVNQYTSVPSGEEWQYDENGNLVSRSATPTPGSLAIIEYDFRNRMVSFVSASAGVDAEYRYDALGRRISKRVTSGGDTSERLFLYGGWQVCEERDPSRLTVETYVYGDRVDEVIQKSDVAGVYYHHSDDLGSIVALSDQGGGVIERQVFTDFGIVTRQGPTGEPLTESLQRTPYAFAGRRFEPESGYYYQRYRYYDPSHGRMTSVDPAGMWFDCLSLGNGFMYAGNRPSSLLDPFGLEGGYAEQWGQWGLTYGTMFGAGAVATGMTVGSGGVLLPATGIGVTAGGAIGGVVTGGVLYGAGTLVDWTLDRRRPRSMEMGRRRGKSREGCKEKQERTCPDSVFREIKERKKDAKTLTNVLGGCGSSDKGWSNSCMMMSVKMDFWLELARARRDEIQHCYNTPDKFHLDEERKAWGNVLKCQRELRRRCARPW